MFAIRDGDLREARRGMESSAVSNELFATNIFRQPITSMLSALGPYTGSLLLRIVAPVSRYKVTLLFKTKVAQRYSPGGAYVSPPAAELQAFMAKLTARESRVFPSPPAAVG
jgi:hypothetical protein